MTILLVATTASVGRRIGAAIAAFGAELATPFAWRYVGRCGGWAYWENRISHGRTVRWVGRKGENRDAEGRFIPKHRSWLAGGEWDAKRYQLVR